MAKKKPTVITDSDITSLDTPWMDESNNVCYDGKLVEKFIKQQLRKLEREKSGYHRISNKDSNGYYHLQTFASRDMADRYDEAINSGGEISDLIIDDTIIPILEMQEGTTFSVSLQGRGANNNIVSIDGVVKVELLFSSTMKEPGTAAKPNDVSGALVVQGRRNQTAAWETKMTLPISSDNEQYQVVDISDAVDSDVEGYQVKLYVDVNDATVVGTTNSVTFRSITKTTLEIKAANWWVNALIKPQSFTPQYEIKGTVPKVLNVRFYDSEGTAETEVITRGGLGSKDYTLQLFRGFTYTGDVLTKHGVHYIESWVSVEGEDEKQSKHIYNSIMVVRSESSEPFILIQDLLPSSTGKQFELKNYVQTTMFRYAVYNPSGQELPLSFVFSNMNGKVVYSEFRADNPAHETAYSFNNTLEVEDIEGTEFNALLSVVSGESKLTSDYHFLVDNSESFAPIAGADFILNPKTRSNKEVNPAVIINSATNEEIEGAIFNNFAFSDGSMSEVEGVDGWTVDENGNKCLRVPAGRYVEIPFDVFSRHRLQNNSNLSFNVEIDFAVRNVLDEETPILAISSDDYSRGIVLDPLEGVVYTATKVAHDEQVFMWEEDVRTHVAINVLHSYRPDASLQGTMSIARVLIDGTIEREFTFDTLNTEEFFVAGQGKSIRIGQDNADIDIYGIRVYINKELSEADVRQNFAACAPTAEDKRKIITENSEVIVNGVVDLDKCLEVGKDCLVWNGTMVSTPGAMSGGQSETVKDGWLDIYLFNKDKTRDLLHSGTLTGTQMKGQGTTAMSYAEWNQQWQWKEASEDKGWTDGWPIGDGTSSGTLRGQKYQLDDTVPAAKKLVNKINFASSMQSHKMGATALYNDLYRRICAADKKILVDQSDPNSGKYRVAVKEKLVYLFNKPKGSNRAVFLGLGTFGPGKMDKPTWGADKDPEFMMLEGADNNITLTDMRCPWDESVVYDSSQEAFLKAGVKSINFNTGKTESIDGDEYPTGNSLNVFKDGWNFLYDNNPFVTHYVGTLSQMKEAYPNGSVYEIWCTEGSDAGVLYRFNEISKVGDVVRGEWVKSGRNGQTVEVPKYATAKNYSERTIMFIQERANNFKSAINSGNYFYKKDCLFNRCFMKHVAGTDNQSKNTYYVSTLCTDGSYKIAQHADDLDTIILTNNVGALTKPYYIEERDKDSTGSYYWEGQANVLFMLIDLAYQKSARKIQIGSVEVPCIGDIVDEAGHDELQDMMYKMYTEMGNLVTEEGVEQSVMGCMQQYFLSTQESVPSVVYNEQARMRYECNQFIGILGSRGTTPLTQSTGSQLKAERQYLIRRIAYLSSWCNYGEFSKDATSASAWAFSVSPNRYDSDENKVGSTIVFNLTPHQWLYPSGKDAGTLVTSYQRMEPGKTYQFTLFTGKVIDGDAQAQLNGINYYRSIGNIGDLPIGSSRVSVVAKGKRLVEFIAEPTNTSAPQFRPASVDFSSGNLKVIKRVSLNGCSETGGATQLLKFYFLEEVDVRNTKINSIILPETTTLRKVYTSDLISTISVKDTPNLSTLVIQGYKNLTIFSIKGKHALNTYQHAQLLFANKPERLTQVSIDNIEWTSCPEDLLMWLVGLKANLSGKISMSSENGAITFQDKLLLAKNYGNIDDINNSLYITYFVVDLHQGDLLIKSDIFMNEVGKTYEVTLVSLSKRANSFKINEDVVANWSIDPASDAFCELLKTSGQSVEIKVNSLDAKDSEVRYEISVSLEQIGNKEPITASEELSFCVRVPKLGDFAYADGTFDRVFHKTLDYIGIAIKVERDYTADNEQYVIMVAYKEKYSRNSWGLTQSYWEASINDILAVEPEALDISEVRNYRNYGLQKVQDFFDVTNVDESMGIIDNNGKANTLAAVKVCENVINKYCIEVMNVPLKVPTIMFDDPSNPGAMSLIKAIQIAMDEFGPHGHQIVYPLLMDSYLFEPAVKENLNAQYKKNNWYIGAFGEVCRFCYYLFRGTTSSDYDGDDELEEKTAIFARAAVRAGENSVVEYPLDDWGIISSTEFYQPSSLLGVSKTGEPFGLGYKNTFRWYVPFVQFLFKV